MNAGELATFFDERFVELEAYMTLLREIEEAARSGPPRIEGSESRITALQQKILYSSVYLQLYNLVEATVTRCIEEVTRAAISDGRWRADDLNLSLRKEWVRSVARTHTDLSPETRLKSAIEMCDHLVDRLPVEMFDIEKGGGGNWDYAAIEKISVRVGCDLQISPAIRTAVKRHVRDDLGSLELVKLRRNDLAHGSISFVDCADGVLVSELRRLVDVVGDYLREVIDCFSSYIDLFNFLRPECRPSESAP